MLTQVPAGKVQQAVGPPRRRRERGGLRQHARGEVDEGRVRGRTRHGQARQAQPGRRKR